MKTLLSNIGHQPDRSRFGMRRLACLALSRLDFTRASTDNGVRSSATKGKGHENTSRF